MFSPTDLSVTVQRARNLVIKGKNSNDAFATMDFNGEKYATRVDENTLGPTWHQECTFQLPQGGVLDKQIVTVTIYHKEHGKLGLHSDAFLGQVQVPLSQLNSSESRERNRWYKLVHKNPKKDKKDRGEVEIGFKFLQISRNIALPDKKSPTTLRNLKSNLKNKLRRRSEDEDSGVGGEGLTRGHSMDNLRKPSPNDLLFERVGKNRSASIADERLSVRGSAKTSSLPRALQGQNKAMSMDVLQQREYSNSLGDVAVKRSNSGGSKSKSRLQFRKGHIRNNSMPNSSALNTGSPNKSKNSSAQDIPSICVNGSHVYISGPGADSGNSSLTGSPEIQRSSSLGKSDSDNNTKKPISPVKPIFRSNRNFNSNSKRHSIADISSYRDTSPLTAVYKPKNYYRLDVKELGKTVSTIHEDPSVSFQAMNREELLDLCKSQCGIIASKDKQIRELEDYIDSLLVKVMVRTPNLLDQSLTTFDV